MDGEGSLTNENFPSLSDLLGSTAGGDIAVSGTGGDGSVAGEPKPPIAPQEIPDDYRFGTPLDAHSNILPYVTLADNKVDRYLNYTENTGELEVIAVFTPSMPVNELTDLAKSFGFSAKSIANHLIDIGYNYPLSK